MSDTAPPPPHAHTPTAAPSAAAPWPDEYARRLRRLARELPPADVPQEVRDAVAAYEAIFSSLDALRAWQPGEGAGAAAQHAVDMLHAWTLYDVADVIILQPGDAAWALAGAQGGLVAALAAPAADAPEEEFLRAAFVAAACAGRDAEAPARMRVLVEEWDDEARARRATAALRALGVRGAGGAVADLRAVAARSLNNAHVFRKQSDGAVVTPAFTRAHTAALERAAALNPRSATLASQLAGILALDAPRRRYDLATAAEARFAALGWDWASAQLGYRVAVSFASGAAGPYTQAQLRLLVERARARLDACKAWAPHLAWQSVEAMLDRAAAPLSIAVPSLDTLLHARIDAHEFITLPTYRRCAACNKQAKEMPRCSRCRSAWYCSPACQRAHWPEHRAACRAAAAAAVAGH